MSWDLAVWDGERPEPSKALDRFSELAEIYEEEVEMGRVAPLTPALDAFLAALVERLPDDTETGPWTFTPIAEEASGPLAILHVQWDKAASVVGIVPPLAREYGLVCLDLQGGALL